LLGRPWRAVGGCRSAGGGCKRNPAVQRSPVRRQGLRAVGATVAPYRPMPGAVLAPLQGVETAVQLAEGCLFASHRPDRSHLSNRHDHGSFERNAEVARRFGEGPLRRLMERSRHSKSMDARSFTSFAARLATPARRYPRHLRRCGSGIFVFNDELSAPWPRECPGIFSLG
jgi:hypothetical protein